ncbi:hypothetical protein O0Q50_23120 [Priestia aryabhattai]|uniref:Uncharacterized protein n=1 Tax=Priestia aryabhattai TaxID=412384 RepID=A0AAX6NDV6_PRIAR|nr:hypothetical protein [Priestia aryabhattai]MDU9694078.1 hypothetical protein [Priestia aryabhattai]
MKLFFIIIMIVFALGAFLVAISTEKKNNNGNVRMKAIMSNLFLLLFSLNCFVSLLVNNFGVISWGIGVLLLLLAAFFTKYKNAPGKTV